MMARLRSQPNHRTRDPRAVFPLEFLDHAAEVWRDDSLFREFMHRQGFAVRGAAPAVERMRPEQRFTMAVEAWADQHDMRKYFNPNDPQLGKTTDWQRLSAEYGIQYPRRLRVVAEEIKESSTRTTRKERHEH